MSEKIDRSCESLKHRFTTLESQLEQRKGNFKVIPQQTQLTKTETANIKMEEWLEDKKAETVVNYVSAYFSQLL